MNIASSSPQDRSDPPSHAANEHVRQWLPFTISEEEIGQRFGVGTQLYFVFIKFIAIINFILFLVSLSNWVLYMRQEPKGVLDDLFTISYPVNLTTAWKASGIAQCVLWFLFPILYYFYLKQFEKRSKNAGNLDHENIFHVRTDDEIEGNNAYSNLNKLGRRLASSLLFVGMVIMSYVVTFSLQSALVTKRERNSIKSDLDQNLLQWADFAVSAVITLWNIVLVLVCYKTTELEKWSTYSKHNFWNLFKVFVFKTISIVAFYEAIYRTDVCTGGFKFFTLILTDLAIGNVIEYGTPLFMGWYNARYGGSNEYSDEKNRPEFDLASEYVELLYRQYIIYLGSAWFPIISGLGFLVTLIEYPLDKFRMLRICRSPTFQNRTLRNYIIGVLYACAVLGLVGSRFGPAFVYTKYSGYNMLPLVNEDGDRCFTYLKAGRN